jgi:hypothetical protein
LGETETLADLSCPFAFSDHEAHDKESYLGKDNLSVMHRIRTSWCKISPSVPPSSHLPKLILQPHSFLLKDSKARPESLSYLRSLLSAPSQCPKEVGNKAYKVLLDTSG